MTGTVESLNKDVVSEGSMTLRELSVIGVPSVIVLGRKKIGGRLLRREVLVWFRCT